MLADSAATWGAKRLSKAALWAVAHFLAAAGAGIAPMAAMAEESLPSCIWHADSSALYQVQTDGNSVAHTVVLKNPVAAAMNGSDCGVYAVAGRQLHRFDASGTELMAVPFRAVSAKLDSPDQLVSDPYDNSVWLAENKTLFHVKSNGELAHTWDAPGGGPATACPPRP